jgi:hypothetical protein
MGGSVLRPDANVGGRRRRNLGGGLQFDAACYDAGQGEDRDRAQLAHLNES